jgi:hypothetical protein
MTKPVDPMARHYWRTKDVTNWMGPFGPRKSCGGSSSTRTGHTRGTQVTGKSAAASHALALCIAIGFTTQHVPLESVATSRPEHVLSRINVYITRASEAESRLGKPTKMQDTAESGYPGSGVVYYQWETDGVQLRASLRYGTRNSQRVESTLCVVEVRGTRPSRNGIGITGSGLALGDSITDVRRRYGSRIVVERARFLHVYWKDGTELEIDLDDKGRICRMRLLAELE